MISWSLFDFESERLENNYLIQRSRQFEMPANAARETPGF
jgi:hypothetical protein